MTAVPPPIVPRKLTPNALVKRHGPAGSLLLRLQRYGTLGWALFFVTSFVFVLYLFADRLAPTPVIAVDPSGRVLGTFQYLNARQRTDQEVLASAMDFTQNYLSLNSASIFSDYAAAMNMMGKTLFQQSKTLITQDDYLARIRAAGAHSVVEFANGSGAPQILERKGLHAAVRLRGKIVVWPAGTGKSRSQPFDLTLFMTAIPRSTLSTQGFRIDAVKDN